MDQHALERLAALDAKLDQIAELARQTLEGIERTEGRLARASAEMIRIGTLAGRPVHLERSEDGSTALFIGQVGVDIGNNVYGHLRSLAFGPEE
jgi:hypothetical protein